jgi:hypothetical protein
VELGAKRSLQWSLGWGIGLGSLALGQLALVPLIHRDERAVWYVGAAASAVGALTRVVAIPAVIGHRRRLRRNPSRGDACLHLRRLEADVALDARWERRHRGIVMHALGLGFSAAVGVLLGVAFRRPIDANRLASTGAVVGEVMVITQPTFMMRTHEAYRRGEFSRSRSRIRAAPWVFPGGGGLGLMGAI